MPALVQGRTIAPASNDARHNLSVRNWRSLDNHLDIAAWDALARDNAEPNPFYESWNLLPALEEFDPDGRVKIWTMQCDGRLVALLPIRQEMGYYNYPLPHLRNWTHGNCFFGAPLVAPGYEKLFWARVFGQADLQAGASFFLHLAQMPATGPLQIALASVLAGDGQDRPAATVMREERAALVSLASPETYFMQTLTTKKRKELRRQQRRLEEEGTLEVERHADAEGLEQWTVDFLALEKRGWKGKSGSALACDKRTARLFTRALKGAALRGRLERLALTIDGKPIAMLANFITLPGAFSYKTTFDEDYARFSPGVLLQRENLELLARDDIAWADSCAASDHPMIDRFWRERRAIAYHSIGIGGRIRRAVFKALARKETGRPVGGLS